MIGSYVSLGRGQFCNNIHLSHNTCVLNLTSYPYVSCQKRNSVTFHLLSDSLKLSQPPAPALHHSRRGSKQGKTKGRRDKKNKNSASNRQFDRYLIIHKMSFALLVHFWHSHLLPSYHRKIIIPRVSVSRQKTTASLTTSFLLPSAHRRSLGVGL